MAVWSPTLGGFDNQGRDAGDRCHGPVAMRVVVRRSQCVAGPGDLLAVLEFQFTSAGANVTDVALSAPMLWH